MAKFPSQRKIQYQTGALSNDVYTQLTSGGVSGDLNIPMALSILNRRGYASTTRSGVPLVYRCKVDFHLQDEDGVGLSLAVGTDFTGTLKLDGCQNNWVMKNAAVKFHAAREKMFRRAGVKKSHRGSYSHEVRYGYDSYNDNWLMPIDGNGDAFTGGTWDLSDFTTEDDVSFKLRLIGTGIDESAAASIADLGIGLSYLQSRGKVADDTNLETSTLPAKFSILNDLLDDSDLSLTFKDDIVSEAQDAQDNPPYDVMAVDDTNNDITEPVELGRVVAGLGNTFGSTIVEIPFGLCTVRGTVHDAADTNITPSGLMNIEVLDIYEMQG
jgi:hypothetical protein